VRDRVYETEPTKVLKDPLRQVITEAYLARTIPDGLAFQMAERGLAAEVYYGSQWVQPEQLRLRLLQAGNRTGC
jgi:hypothetical protein